MKIEANIFQVEATRSQNISGASSKYHRAAVDGYVDMLCDASKRDTNLSNKEDGLTPTLLAAQTGHLDALRILVGRGGDPERTAADGSSALHLAAVRGHLNCVSFLVNFGVNMWSLDNDLHTAKDVAAIEQRKEVLDFLDSMMAKQSAFNTKNVQKLKEKAKVAAEKRIKQLRKAQLKAIKRVEKDERYLKKLSHNRRLLKAAHSISDIKLVGRHQPTTSIHLSSMESRSGGCGGSISSLSRLSSSPSLANLMNHKLQMDLLGRSRQVQHHQATPSSGASRLLSRQPTGASASTTDGSSAYSSSSVSSYLSSRSAGRTRSPKRPKYSDLIAVNGAELARWQRKRLPASGGCTERQSLKSTSIGSTVGTKLWGIGGVSRKVQLRRLLKAGAQFSSDLASTCSGLHLDAAGVAMVAHSNDNMTEIKRAIVAGKDGASGSGGTRSSMGKLCNVQPTMRLKLNSTEARPLRSPSGQSQDNKWLSHGSMMARTISEPDFRAAALRQSPSSSDEEDFEENSDANVIKVEGAFETSPTSKLSPAVQMAEEVLKLRAPCDTAPESRCQSEDNDEVHLHSRQQPHPVYSKATKDDSRHQLLNQCLSQLKLRHEELTMRTHQDEMFCEPNSQLLKRSKLGNKARLFADKQQGTSGGADFFDSSDELIKHQLMAGEFPLRPSLIKQKQQQQSNHLPCQKAVNSYVGQQQQQQDKNKSKNKKVDAGSTTISVDSIGSAGSFAKRNACSSSASAKSSSDLSSSGSYSSTCSTSSVEMAAPSRNNNGAPKETAPLPEGVLDTFGHSHHHRSPPPPPLPPPLPSKTRPSAVVNCRLVGQTGSRKQANQDLSQLVANIDTESTIETFLKSNGLEDLSELFAREKIDLEALVLLTEEDLKSLNILLGPRRKLLKAIGIREQQVESRQGNLARETNVDVTKPMYIMVDTQL